MHRWPWLKPREQMLKSLGNARIKPAFKAETVHVLGTGAVVQDSHWMKLGMLVPRCVPSMSLYHPYSPGRFGRKESWEKTLLWDLQEDEGLV